MSSTLPRAAPIHALSLYVCLAYLATGVAAQTGTQTTGGPNTSLAMIILYAITGCVSALFCVVIVSGAIRAIRHPERYGPRTGEAGFDGATAQSRARGLTRAILDTFPVVKFGVDPATGEAPRPKDIENPDEESYELEVHAHSTSSKDGHAETQTIEVVSSALADGRGASTNGDEADGDKEEFDVTDARPTAGQNGEDSFGAGSSKLDAEPVVRPRMRPGRSQTGPHGDAGGNGGTVVKEVVPDAIGTETCPICILDFEEGDDLRILPCEGHHRFHRDCVDQWLLELSSSCPICRQDFHALEMMMAGEDDRLEPPRMPAAARPLSTAAARFSRYLRSARRRHDRHREDGSGFDITDPPMPLAPEGRY
ncbi:hypothetical protein POSPLADRAFT_1031290 [Postia placenta MAD-698-R-SB12]|uniref:RING-type domain-containing protein n=1 Tax=Postia placenta MAD-698-R-SB12 TaxID=670580 RepID=A0A1X6NCD5_9APHY|nr:hypothetical protein POSPLADRAFT_1031290 [Postia placenta MAD-698-R-SB12]OSX66170.1 hypothetical protein POSPLADRAFT_1031290 [Postia placenta MAD-698-R-SB12]